MESRLPTLFLLVCKQHKQYQIQELAAMFAVSTRTIYNDIKKLNEFLLAEAYAGIVVDRGIIAYPEAIELSFEELVNFSQDYVLTHQRIRRLRLLSEVLMVETSFTIDELIKKLPISRNTISKDLKWVRKELQGYHIALVSQPFIGYSLQGKEQDIRQLLVQTVLEDPLSLEEGKKNSDLLHQAEVLLDLCGEALQVVLSDRFYDLLKTTFWAAFMRLSIKKPLTLLHQRTQTSVVTKEARVLLDLKTVFAEMTGLPISDDELIYLSQKFTEASLLHNHDDISENWIDYNLIVDQFIKRVAALHHAPYFIEDQMLYEGILNHLRPAYHRYLSQSSIKNPMKDYIQASFYGLHQDVQQGVQLVEERLNVRFDAEEVSFFTLFFIASLERNKQTPKKAKTIVIVCDAGISTSQILRSKLEVHFDVTVQGVFGKRTAAEWLDKHPVDLIISTVEFHYPSIFSIKVAPFVTEEDMTKLYRLLNTKKETISMKKIMSIIKQSAPLSSEQEQSIQQDLASYLCINQDIEQERGAYQPMLVEVLHEGLISTNNPAKTREEAVIASGELLVGNNLAKPSYIEGMLENVKVNGTYIVIAPGIAMPHARPESGALDIGLSIVTLKEPVVFGHPTNDPVRIVVGLCAIDHQSHLKALAELVELLSDEEQVKQIVAAKTPAAMMELIKGGV